MKNAQYFPAILLFVLLAVLAAACNQDAIFYIISREVAPLKPRIEGAPTAMAVFEREYTFGGAPVSVPVMYVASSRLHWYARPKTDYDPAAPAVSMPKWDSADYRLSQPGGKIISLAVTPDYLYVLSISGSGTAMTLKRTGKHENDVWETVAVEPKDYAKIQTIYAASGRLFAGAGTADARSFAILYMDENGASPQLKMMVKTDSYLLTGAAYDGTSYYLTTSGKGVYMTAESSLASAAPAPVQLGDTADVNAARDKNFQGIIEIPNGAVPPQIVAVERSGMLYDVTAAGFTEIQNLLDSSAKKTTGALAVYGDINGKMLLAGTRYDTSGTTTAGYTNGYIELNYSAGGILDSTSERHEPGKPVSGTSLTTVGDHDRYAATLGKHSINHLFQVPAEVDSEKTLFAATQTAGLWSYRNRADGWQWNAEE
ncbi:MAG: hypothetical protein LBD48_04285 [Treponema sp.]|jgi:hypothetical protein|nr:hypothetical protein [Treponema sp.]